MYIQSKNGHSKKTVRANIGIELGLETEEEAFIEFEEMGTRLMIALAQAYAEDDKKRSFDILFEGLEATIRDHNLYVDENTKMTNAELMALLENTPKAGIKVFNEYIQLVLFTQGKKND